MIQMPWWAATLLLAVAWAGGFAAGVVYVGWVCGKVVGIVMKDILGDPRWKGGGR